MSNKPLVFYTVRCDQPGYPVTFVDRFASGVQTFRGPFGDPGEASQEFQLTLPLDQPRCYLQERPFERKAQALAALRREEYRKLHRWQTGSSS